MISVPTRRPSISESWNVLLDSHDIVAHVDAEGLYKITAAEINEVREARLMAKFDESASLPAAFREHGLSILPVGRGDYVVGRFDAYAPIEYSSEPITFVEPPELTSLDPSGLYSEAAALLFAYNSGIIADLLGESPVHFTVAGRMKSGSFHYQIARRDHYEKQVIRVNNAQVEIDAGYESPEHFCVFEAKNVSVSEMLIRQLYYPYRLWRNKLEKPVIPAFLVYSNDVFNAFVYEFSDPYDYNSLTLVRRKRYALSDEPIHVRDLQHLLDSTRPTREPTAPFPQANSFPRIVDLLSVLAEKDMSHDEVTNRYEFDERQTDYYVSAGCYLGLVERRYTGDSQVIYALTPTAQRIMALPYRTKYLGLAGIVLQKPVFREAFRRTLDQSDVPTNEEIAAIISMHRADCTGSTPLRRASTVRGWITWISELAISDE